MEENVSFLAAHRIRRYILPKPPIKTMEKRYAMAISNPLVAGSNPAGRAWAAGTCKAGTFKPQTPCGIMASIAAACICVVFPPSCAVFLPSPAIRQTLEFCDDHATIHE
jgi:hypothetical protein